MQDAAESDEVLLARVVDRDEAALRTLVERHSAWLLMRLRRRSANDELVASTVQDTFVAVWRHPERYRGDGEFGAWLWGIAIRRLVSQLRTRPRPVPLAGAAIASLTPTVRSAEDALLVAVEHGDVGQALTRLSPQLREALQATVIDGLSTREAARLIGIPHGTVKSRVRLAKSQLRRQMMEGLA